MTEISATEYKNLGNEAFCRGNYQEAIDFYNKGLEIILDDPKLNADIFKNRAMAKLKINDFEGAELDCTKVLELEKYDVKALYRRALARQKLNKIGPAFVDAKQALKIQPRDRSIIELCASLMKLNTDCIKKTQSAENKVSEMLKLTFENSKNGEKHLTGLNNLYVLCRESEYSAQQVWRNGKIVDEMLKIITNKADWTDDAALFSIRILDELSKKRERACEIINIMNPHVLTRLLSMRSDTININTTSALIQHVFNGLAAMNREEQIKPDKEICEQNKLVIVRLVLELEEIITDPQFSALVREACLDLLLKNLMHMDGGLPRGWSWRFVEDRGLLKLLHIACQVPEQCDYPVTMNTRQHVSIFLTRLYDDMLFDTRRAIFKEKVDQFFNDLMLEIGERNGRIKIAALLVTLLQGPVDTGISLVTNDAITAMMLEMASNENDHVQQSIATELIVCTVSKHDRVTAIIKSGLPVLRKLFSSNNLNVKIRALVGLCKCASAGGDDYSRQTMNDEVILKLAKECKKFLIQLDKFPIDIEKFACEALSYLSLDAEVKEFIVEDLILLKSLADLAQMAGSVCVFTISSIYVNLCNAYDKPKIDEEMIKLAQFAKHHVPETHPKDTDDYVDRRIKRLIENQAVAACVAISKTDSKNALDNLASCLLAFTNNMEFSGKIISEGGAKLLLTLYKNCNPKGKIKAAHALAKLGVRSDPSIAFPGQRCFEIIKPLIDLLHPEIDGKANYDAMLTLTNLASKNDLLRKHIIKEKGIPKIEEYWFNVSHEHLRSAAAELLLNLLYCEEYFNDLIKSDNDRLKLWVLYCDEGEDRLKLASSAGFVLLTRNYEFCQKILGKLKNWEELFSEMIMAENAEVQRRCLMGIANMIESSEKVASEIISSKIFQILVAITKLKNDNDRKNSILEAQRALDAAEKRWSLIKSTERQIYENKTKLSSLTE